MTATLSERGHSTHQAAVELRQLRGTLLLHLTMIAVWAGLAAGTWTIAWQLWPEAIRIRALPVALYMLGLGSMLWSLIVWLVRGNGIWWLLFSLGCHAASYLLAVSRGAPLRGTLAWHGPLYLLALWITVCVFACTENLVKLGEALRMYRAAGRRLARDSKPIERPIRVFAAVEAARDHWNDSRERPPLARLTFFGDPETEPDRVIVWGVYTRGTEQEWMAAPAGYSLASSLAGSVNQALREEGYPCTIDVGVADIGSVDAGGGDWAYFGADGRLHEPQVPASQR